MEKAVRDVDIRNVALNSIAVQLDSLAVDCSDWPGAKLNSKIRPIAGEWSGHFYMRVMRKGSWKRIEWSYRRHLLCATERRDDKL